MPAPMMMMLGATVIFVNFEDIASSCWRSSGGRHLKAEDYLVIHMTYSMRGFLLSSAARDYLAYTRRLGNLSTKY